MLQPLTPTPNQAFDEAEGVDKLEGLQEHKNADIYDKVRAASP